MNICWVSPLDPELTEIARYSVQILPFVEKYMGVSAVHDGDGAAPGWWDKRQEESAVEEGVAPLPIYHIGNNSLHLPVYRQALLEPGLVVLHDVSLVDLAKTLSRESDYPELWNWQMREQYGDDVDDLVISSENSVARIPENRAASDVLQLAIRMLGFVCMLLTGICIFLDTLFDPCVMSFPWCARPALAGNSVLISQQYGCR